MFFSAQIYFILYCIVKLDPVSHTPNAPLHYLVESIYVGTDSH